MTCQEALINMNTGLYLLVVFTGFSLLLVSLCAIMTSRRPPQQEQERPFDDDPDGSKWP